MKKQLMKPLRQRMLRTFGKLLFVIFSLLAYGQASAACNLSFSTTVGGQVTQSGPEYKYTFSTTDYANCDPGGKTDGTGASLGIYVDAIGNQNSAGNKTFPSSSAHGTNNVYIMSIGGSTGPTNIDAFYYTPPNGYAGPDSFTFYDFNGSPYTVNVTVVAPVPGAPTGVTATPGSGQASVAFTAPASDGGSAILDYTVTSSPGNFTATGAASPLVVLGLTNGTAYTFTVTARNTAGSGAASTASTAVTPKAVQTITFNDPGPQSFGTTPTLSATASSGLTPTFSSTTTGVCTITSGGVLTFVTAGSCTIHADQAGNAVYSAATTVPQTFTVSAIAPSAPGNPVGTSGNGQVSVAFTAPSSSGGSAILDYTVTSSPGNFTATGAASPLTVLGLTNGTAYTFTVTARNTAGSGAASSASTAVTPQAPQTITFNDPGPQSFGTTPTLSATASSGLTPTFSSTTTGVCTITSGGALTFVTAGSCTIHADQAGNAAFSAATTVPRTFTVSAIAPGAPGNPVGTAGNGQVSVAFTAPSSNGGSAVIDYTVTSNPGGFIATGAASPLTVLGLTNGTAYTFTVTARNTAGSGAASSASTAVTPKAPQTITFNDPGPQSFGTTPTLSATASSGLTPTFSSTTTGVCTITSGGALTFVTAGSCTIHADQAGNAAFSAAPMVPQTFPVNAVVPGAPTSPVATAGINQASVAFTAPAWVGGSAVIDYTVTSSPGNVTATGAASPLVIGGLTNGTAYTFTVTARNTAGSGAVSTASNSVTPNPGPAVASVAVPANGSYLAGQNLDFTVVWDKAAIVTGTPQIALTIGATAVQANYISSPTPTTSLFRYTVLSGQFDNDGIAVGTLNLGGGTIKGSNGVDAVLTLNSVGSTSSVLVDAVAPTLPAANVVVNNQSDPHKVILTFSKALAAASVGSAGNWSVTANGGTPAYAIASVALTGANAVTLTLAPVSLTNAATTITNAAATGHIKVTPPATLTDLVGNLYAGGQVTESGATHVPDGIAPSLSAVATSGSTTTGGVLAATASEKAMGYWIAVATGAAAPTVAQVKARVSYGAVTLAGHGSAALASGVAGNFSITGLSPNTTYALYVVAEDAAGNLSATVSTASLATAALPNPFTPLPVPPPIAGVNGTVPTAIDMRSGNAQALASCTADTIRQVLGGDAVYLGQGADGATRIQWNNQIISFYPLSAAGSDARASGLHTQSANPLDVVTRCGSMNVAPAVYSLGELGATLAARGWAIQINSEGVITLTVDGVTYVVRPDFVVTPGRPGAPSLYVGDDGLYRFSDSAGNTQIMRPAFLDTDALRADIGTMGGAMTVQIDATVLVSLRGSLYVLTPDIALGGVSADHANQDFWSDGVSRYRYKIVKPPQAGLSQGTTFSLKP